MQPPIPEPAEILQGLRAQHPRLLLTPQRLRHLRALMEGHDGRPAVPRLRAWLDELRTRADELAATDLPAARKGTIASRFALEQTLVPAVLFLFTEEQRYADLAARAMALTVQREDWRYTQHGDRAFDLGTAEVCVGLALGRDWLHGRLDPELDQRAGHWLREQGLKNARVHYERPPGQRYWPDNTNNWNQVCNGGVILAALATAEEDRPLAELSLAHALASLPKAMAEFAPDGGWKEGPNYWRYGVMFNCLALSALETALGHDFRLGDMPGFDQTGYFCIHMTGPTGAHFNFGDCGAVRCPAPHLWYLASRFRDPALAHARLGMIEDDRALFEKVSPDYLVHEHGVRGRTVHYYDLIWYDHDLAEAPASGATGSLPSVSSSGATGSLLPVREHRPAGVSPSAAVPLPPDRLFRETEVVTLRTRWNDPLATWVAFKAGRANCSHAHMDAGTFILEARGQRWAEDLGGDSYGLPGYFETWAGSARRHYSFYRIRTEGHNTLVINPHVAPQQDPAATARILRTGFHESHAFALADLSPLYARQARSVLRGVRLERESQNVLLRDEVSSEEAVDFWWFLHTRAEVDLIEGGRSAMLQLAGERLWAAILGPEEARFTVLDARPMVHSPDPAGQADNAGVRKLTIHLEVAVNPQVTVWLVPLAPGQAAPTQRPPSEALARWW